MRIAILALQGAFIEHELMMRGLGCDVFEIRKLSDWNQPKDGLIIPGEKVLSSQNCLMNLDCLFL